MASITSGTNTRGPFYSNSRVRMGDMTDGTSNTAVFSEIKMGPLSANTESSTAPTYTVGSPEWFTSPARIGGEPASAAEQIAPPAACETPGANWRYRGKQYFRGLLVANYYNHSMPPNARLRDCIWDANTFGHGHLAARSYHSGGVNVVLADGSVRFGSESVDANVWRAVGSRAGGEVVSDF